MLRISTYPALIKFKDHLDGIHHCVTALGKWIFDSKFTFAFPLTKENLDYCCINYNETKLMNGYKGVSKVNMFFTREHIKSITQK